MRGFSDNSAAFEARHRAAVSDSPLA